ncbi:MAG: CRISPR-associated endoribonuclease Cas6 [Thermoproteota archaeon]
MPCEVPLHYNYLLQSSIYRALPSELSRRLHRDGFIAGKRRFRLFVFSRLLGRRMRARDCILFPEGAVLYVSSPIPAIVRGLVNSLAEAGGLNLNGRRLRLAGFSFLKDPEIPSGSILVRMLSPVTVYSTVFKADGRRMTYYYSPYEKGFSELVDANLRRKCALLGVRCSGSVEVAPIRVREVAVVYKRAVVRGWCGIFRLSGPGEMLRVAYETGIGSRNPQGFGMFEVVECSTR